MSIELSFTSLLPAPFDVVWGRAVAVDGANDELWPLANMTFPFHLDARTPPEQVLGRTFRSWMLGFGFVPVDRRTMTIEVFERGRFRECSTSLLQGRVCHERTAEPVGDGSTSLTDTLTAESRGRVLDALLRSGVTTTFQRRHRRLRRHFEKKSRRDSA